jgi:hypothetical protein
MGGCEMKSNWDKDGNWIGDDLEDSGRDWGVKADTESFGEAAGYVGHLSVGVFKIVLRLGITIGVFTLMIWIALKIIGVV